MKYLFETLIFFGCFWGQLLKCHAQFNTVSRDTVPVQLIGQPSQQPVPVGSSIEQVGGSLEQGESLVREEQEGEKYYEMPETALRGMSGRKRKTWFRWPFKKSSEKDQAGIGFGKNVFGKKRKRGPQVIIMPVQTIEKSGEVEVQPFQPPHLQSPIF